MVKMLQWGRAPEGAESPTSVEPLRDMLAKAMRGVKFEQRIAKWGHLRRTLQICRAGAKRGRWQ